MLDDLHSEKKEVLLCLFNALPLVNIEDHQQEYFDLFKVGVEKGYFLEKGEISPVNFNNIVRIACQVKQLQWAENFIATHKQYLNKPPKLYKNIMSMVQCFLQFGKQEYQKTITDLEKLYLEDYSYGLNKHNLLLKSTFELHKYSGREELKKIMAAYKAYVNYKVKQGLFSDELRGSIFNFLKIFRLILDYPFKNNSKSDLLLMVNSYEGRISETRWLKEKIKQLKRY